MQCRVAGLDVLQGGVGARLEEEVDRRLLAVRRSVLRCRERAASAFILGMGVRGCRGKSGVAAAHHERRDAKVVTLVDVDSGLRLQQRAQPCHVSAPRCSPHRPLHPCRATPLASTLAPPSLLSPTAPAAIVSAEAFRQRRHHGLNSTPYI